MSHWQKLTEPPKLVAGELHIWQIDLDRHDDQWQPLMALLSSDEQRKAYGFRFDKHRQRYIIGSAMLRILLGSYLGYAPGTLRFTYNDHGKLSVAQNNCGLNFNAFHTEDTMLAGFVLNSKIGIDIEIIRSDIDCIEPGKHRFSDREYKAFKSLPEHEQSRGFFRTWTRKEAYIKALGIGLSYPLSRFSVSMDSTNPALIEHQDDSYDTKKWQIYDIEISDSCSAAVVVEASNWNIHYYLESHPYYK